MKNDQGPRRKVLFLTGLIGIGIILGAIVVYAINSKGATDSWEFMFEDGRIVLDADDRERLKEQALDITLGDDEIKKLIDGKDYTAQVTLFGNVEFETIEQTTLSSTKRFIIIEEDLDELNVVVTITFEDGSGYNIPVDWENWTVGEPEFAEQVSAPEKLNIVVRGPNVISREAPIQSR